MAVKRERGRDTAAPPSSAQTPAEFRAGVREMAKPSATVGASAANQCRRSWAPAAWMGRKRARSARNMHLADREIW